MKNVTDRTSNPFGMRPPLANEDADRASTAFGYGDANADFHLIGDHPGAHGGKTTGVPFTETESATKLQDLLRDVEFVSGPPERPTLEDLFFSYIHTCTRPGGRTPTSEEYAQLERYFDAELRAINAHILLPVGEQATDHVLRAYTTQRSRLELEMSALHAEEIRGRGFMVVPIQEPTEWEAGDRETIHTTLESILASDYRQTKGIPTLVG